MEGMNREQLKERIQKLPLFERRVVKVEGPAQERLEADIEKEKDYAKKVEDMKVLIRSLVITKGITEEESDKLKEVIGSSQAGNFKVQRQEAICEVGHADSYAYVAKGYKLVQFKEIFEPLLDSIEGDVRGYVVNDGGYASMLLFPKQEALMAGQTKFGLRAVNSVNMTTGIIIKFVASHGGLQFTFPPKVSGLKKPHTGDVSRVVKNYLKMIGTVKDAWSVIVEKFPTIKIVEDKEQYKGTDTVVELGEVFKELKIGDRMGKKIRQDHENTTLNGQDYTLWDLLHKIMDLTSSKNYKSDAHRERAMEDICGLVYEYSVILSI